MVRQRETAFPAETAEPEAIEEEESAPAPAPPTAPSPAPERPKIPALFRILFPLLFILIPLLNFFLRELPFRSGSTERPVLQQVLFYESILEGRPVNPQTVFSLRQHRRVVLYARWSGSRERHSYSFRWYTPEGTLQPASASVTRVQLGQGEREFSTYAILPLEPGMPLGRWQAEIAVDQSVQARPSFELRE